VARVGPSPLSQHWRVLITYELGNFLSGVSNSLLTVPVENMVIQVAQVAILSLHTYIQMLSQLNLLQNIHILELRALVCTRRDRD